jgi:hypothetical protein
MCQTQLLILSQLIQDVLIDSCALVSNFSWSTGTNFGSTNGIGSFKIPTQVSFSGAAYGQLKCYEY